MSDGFDPYYTWLGIPPQEQPPDHYRLLGVRQFENNVEVISNAADQRMAHIRSFQIGSRAEHAQAILNELSQARTCLLGPDKKGAYDRELRQKDAPRLSRSSGAAQSKRVASTASPAVAALPIEAELVSLPPEPQPAYQYTPAPRYAPAGSGRPLWQHPLLLVAVAGVALVFLGLVGLSVAYVGAQMLASSRPSWDQGEVQVRPLPNPVPPPPRLAPIPAADQIQRSQWLNETHNLTLRRIGHAKWADFDNRSGQRQLEYEEIAHMKDYLELRAPLRNEIVRFYANRAEIQRGGEWQWVANGRWDTSPKEIASLPVASIGMSNSFLVKGRAAIEENTWITHGGPGYDAIMFPGPLPEEYVVETVVTRLNDNEGLVQGLVVGNRQCMVTVDGFKPWGMRTALDLIDGRRAGSAQDPCEYRGQLLTKGKPSTLKYYVRKDRLIVECDGKTILTWTGGMGRLSLFPLFSVPDNKAIFWGSWDGSFSLSKLEVRPIKS